MVRCSGKAGAGRWCGEGGASSGDVTTAIGTQAAPGWEAVLTDL